MAVLRERTVEHHDRAEHHPFHRALAKGKLPIEAFSAYLGQMLFVHRRLDAALEAHRDSIAAIGEAVTEEQYQTPYLEADLPALGLDLGAISPLPETEKAVAWIEELSATKPLGLLGAHYVVEGSNNGSKYIAMNLRRVYGITPENGLKYMDPYGERQPTVWGEFKGKVGGMSFTDEQEALIVESACGMFDAIEQISCGLQRELGAVIA